MAIPDPQSSVVIYGRPGCHLCQEALAILTAIRNSGAGFEIVEVDIEEDDELHSKFLELIPVVELDGVIVAQLDFSRDQLEDALSRAATVDSEHGAD
jgi:glutaredoxin